MKIWGFVSGVALGMTAATIAVTSIYPDVQRRMKRDGKRMLRGMTRMF